MSLIPQSMTLNPELPRRRILVVEDHADSAVSLARLLESYGYFVRIAYAAAEAIEAARESAFDLVIADIALPDGDGCDLMGELNRRHGLRGIAMSGHDAPDDLTCWRNAGFVHQITKPFEISQVIESIGRVTDLP